MSKRCKHKLFAQYVMSREVFVDGRWRMMVWMQCDCGAWLSLGPSNDDSDAVRVEMRAAHLAQRDTCESEFTQAEWLGWNGDEQYIMCGSLRTVWDDMPDERFAAWEAGVLAAEIAGAVDGCFPRATHDAAKRGGGSDE